MFVRLCLFGFCVAYAKCKPHNLRETACCIVYLEVVEFWFQQKAVKRSVDYNQSKIQLAIIEEGRSTIKRKKKKENVIFAL